ncbi:DUF488 domain-containing protein [Micromonospora sp. NBC_00617]|uniref:DUF488 domain-containing protein n=1 Tax=Micromonospora sp. NBC_00617 TaxID=2903587 RepID=UPI0030E0A8E8
MKAVTIRRVYDGLSPDDGVRVLVDRVWPRGLTKEAVYLDEWIKHIAPSTPLRRWYGHQPERFVEFRRRYLIELQDVQSQVTIERLRKLASTTPITLPDCQQGHRTQSGSSPHRPSARQWPADRR